MSDVMDMFWRAPPVSRTIALAAFVVSIGCHGRLVPFHWFVLDFDELFRMPPQLWRLVTSFLITFPNLSILLDPYFLYSYLKQLEIGNPRMPRREDLIWYLIFVGGSIITLDKVIFGQGGSYMMGLTLALAYTCTQDQRGLKTNFYFITIPAQLAPHSMILVNFIINGPGVLPLMLCGMLSAHLYDFLTRLWPEFGGGRNLIPTPAFLSRVVAAPAQRVQDGGYGQAYQGAARASGSSSGPLPDSWQTRGRGHRLG